MAKLKEKKSIQSLLAESVVLSKNTTYKIPGNWCWVNLKTIVRHQSGNSKLIKGKLPSEYRTGLYNAYSASGQDVFYEKYEHEGEAIIVSAVGARCGKAFMASGKWSAIANTHIIFSSSRIINLSYLFYMINNENWWIKSGSAQPFVVVNASLERPFPLPPIEEQNRIVEKINILFSQLDEARDLIQSSLDAFENHKAAILNNAFDGKLTAKWREYKGLSLNDWRETKLGEITYEFKYGTSEKSDYSFNGCPVLRITNIADGLVDLSDIKFLANKNIEKSYMVDEDDILIIRSNGSRNLVGKNAIVKGIKGDYAFASFLIRLRLRIDLAMPTFISRLLNSLFVREQLFLKAKSSSGIHNINTKELSNICLTLPPLAEQQEIVYILDEFFEKEDKSKELLETLNKIDEMKKSILARAFRGELGTNNTYDEPAIELLKRILEDK